MVLDHQAYSRNQVAEVPLEDDEELFVAAGHHVTGNCLGVRLIAISCFPNEVLKRRADRGAA